MSPSEFSSIVFTQELLEQLITCSLNLLPGQGPEACDVLVYGPCLLSGLPGGSSGEGGGEILLILLFEKSLREDLIM